MGKVPRSDPKNELPMRNDLSSKLTKVAFLTLLLGCMCPVTSRAQPVASPTTPDVTALCDAIQERRWPEALRIVEAGVAVTNTDQKGRSALAVLTQSWFGSTGDDKLRQQLLRELLDGGADPFASGYSGFYPRGDLAVVEEALQKVDSFLSDLLLTNRPSPARRTPRGDTALHLAAQSARNNMIAFLLSAGFSVNQTNSDGLTPLQCVASLAAKGTFTLTNDSPPLFLRWQFKGDGIVPWFPSVAELLLSRGAILDACSAAGMGMTNQLAGLLRANPASLNMQDGLGRTPLHYASLAYQTNTAALLIQAGADTSFLTTKPIARTRDRDAIAAGASPLHLACLRASHEIVQMLLKVGAPVDQRDADGNTPLHLAALWGATNCPWLLITAHAPLDATNNAGKTSLRIAVERGNNPNVELLLTAGARTDVGLGGETLLHVAATEVGPDYFSAKWGGRSIPVLLRHGLAVDARDGEERTPLQRAVTSLNWNAMNLLLTNGANLNAVDDHGNTALHQIAIQNRDNIQMAMPMDPLELERLSHLGGQQRVNITSTNISVTGWLLNHGANPNLTNHEGRTPLELVCGQHWGYWDKKMATNRITLLLKAGAKVSKPGFDSLEACLEKIK
jgi:ankyrin repeat protein